MARIPQNGLYTGLERAARGFSVQPIVEAGYRATRAAEIIFRSTYDEKETEARAIAGGIRSIAAGLEREHRAAQKQQQQQANLAAIRDGLALREQFSQPDVNSTPAGYKPLVSDLGDDGTGNLGAPAVHPHSTQMIHETVQFHATPLPPLQPASPEGHSYLAPGGGFIIPGQSAAAPQASNDITGAVGAGAGAISAGEITPLSVAAEVGPT